MNKMQEEEIIRFIKSAQQLLIKKLTRINISVKSPANINSEMSMIEVDHGLRGYQCKDTGGVWVNASSFWRWRQIYRRSHARNQDPIPVVHVKNNSERFTCTESGIRMTKFLAKHTPEFVFYHSAATGSIWITLPSWNIILQSGTVEVLHKLFLATYQKTIKAKSALKPTAQFQVELTGAERSQLEILAEWLKKHPEKKYILNWLENETFDKSA